MWSNLIFGLVIPLFILFFLYKRNPALVLLMYPLGVTIAYTANDWGFDLFWDVEPDHENPSLSAIPPSLGYFPMITALFAFTRKKYHVHILWHVFIYASVATLIEGMMVLTGKVHYYHGWNILFTFLIYISGFITVAIYVHVLRKYHIRF
ncbi:hypothetical protein GCM10007216_29130 [Thalassobacillus devorans]|uniref:Uncharacterized protein n=1 Tax=Thalassobacillus devorans TaxID=279813 RepID=A0ABQ1PG53_9BACI|nr:hypothetical protein [Thalassobacillus devorans]NIK29418.1 hypothetical protein [Thalassobacillus devorans]GGC96548.1 hypothetical protein GCM10007216_29130 [Thalassobacillus devorans]